MPATRFLQIAVLSLALISGSTAHARTINFQGVTIDLPAGWTERQRGKKQLVLGDGRAGTIALLISRASKRPAAKEFKALIRQLGATGKRPWRIYPAMTARGHPVNYASGFVKRKGKRAYLLPVATRHGGKTVVVMLLNSRGRGSEKQKQHLGQVLASLRFNKSTGQGGPSKASQADPKLAGFYASVGSKAKVTALGNLKAGVGVNGLLLRRDGRYALSETIVATNFDAYCKRLPKNCGTYRVENGRLYTLRPATRLEQMLQLQRAKSRAVRVDASGDLLLDKVRYRRIKPHRGVLSGRYRSASADSNTGPTGNTAGAYIEGAYEFLPNGRFSYGGFVAQNASTGNTSVVVGGKKRTRAGSYRLDGYKLVLDFDTGKDKTNAFFMMGDVPVIDGAMYQRVK